MADNHYLMQDFLLIESTLNREKLLLLQLLPLYLMFGMSKFMYVVITRMYDVFSQQDLHIYNLYA